MTQAKKTKIKEVQVEFNGIFTIQEVRDTLDILNFKEPGHYVVSKRTGESTMLVIDKVS